MVTQARHLAGCPAHLEGGPGDGGAHTETGPLGTSRPSLPQVCDFLSLDHSSVVLMGCCMK